MVVYTQQIEARFAQFLQKQPRIILGSASFSRRQIMDELLKPHNIKYEVITADIDEKAIRREKPQELVKVLAHAKAVAIQEKMRASGSSMNGILITCDQVVVRDGEILEKPDSQQEARDFIASYATHSPSTVGSVLCTNLDTGATAETIDIATIHFKPIPEESVDKMLEEGDCMFCAGGLMVEHPLVVPHVTRMDGPQDSVMGLCKESVMKLLMEVSGHQ